MNEASEPATVIVTGASLRVEDVAEVARDGVPVELDPDVRARMSATREVFEEVVARGEPVYGATTGVGVQKRVEVDPARASAAGRRLLETHAVGQGPLAPPDVARATALCLLNGLASGVTGARPQLADRLVAALVDGVIPPIRSLGSIGQADLAPLADLALGLLGDVDLEPGEALALVNANAYSTAIAALAVHDGVRLLGSLEVTAGVGLEGFAANASILHPALLALRPYPGLARTVDRLRTLLEGSALWDSAAARNLQDPISFRSAPVVLGALGDALEFARGRVEIEMNASQGNPVVLIEERRVLPVANFEVLPLAQALDLARIGLAPALTSAQERVLKLLDTPWSGLPTGLVPDGGSDNGLAIHGIVAQALAAEARLLALPVSFEVTSTTGAEGIEDRMTMAPLAARRLASMVALGERIAAIELLIGAQAAELRGLTPLGRGTAEASKLLWRLVPPPRADEPAPADLEPVVELVRSGALARLGEA